MSNNPQIVSFDTLRSLAFGSIGATYAPVGVAFTHPVRLVSFDNATDGDLFVSDDGVNDKLFMPAGTFKLFDLNTNRNLIDQVWVLPVGTQIFVRYGTAPSSKAFYVACLWGL